MKLATPKTQDEFNDLVELYTLFSNSTGNDWVKAFLGIQYEGGQYVELVSREPINYNIKWTNPNPSYDGTCMELVWYPSGDGIGQNDLPCSEGYTRNFICERNGRYDLEINFDYIPFL